MEFQLLNRIAEIKKHLGPVLAELGLRPKIGSANGGSLGLEDPEDKLRPALISFQSEDGSTFSPVEIILGVARGEVLDLSWDGSSVKTYRWDMFEVASNWKHFDKRPGSRREVLGTDLASNFTLIERELRENNLVSAPGKVENCTADLRFAKAYEELEIALSPINWPLVTCKREAGVESYNFDGPDGSYKIAFEGESAVLYVEDERVSSCPADKDFAVGNLIRMRLSDVESSKCDI